MERRIIAGALHACAVIVLGLSLAACNPFDIVSSVQDEVKLANNRYLNVKSADPAKNATLVNPGESLWIEFDRDIDTATLTATSITIVDTTSASVSWGYTYDENLKTLYLQAALDGLKTYTVTVTQELKGTDGNSLREPYSWSFTTANLPSGTIQIEGGLSSTTSNTVTLNITYNTAVQALGMRYSMNASDLTGDAGTGITWVTTNTSVSSFSMSGSVGLNTVYIQFRDASNNVSPVIADSIWYGEVPNVSATKNSTAKGTVTVSWSAVRQDRGTNTYSVYERVFLIRRFVYVNLGSTTGTSLSVSASEGTLHNYYVRAYNEYGGNSPYTTTAAIGYTSDIAIIYNDSDSTDTTLAENLSSMLTTDLVTTYPSSISGTMPTWTVTLVPQSMVSTTYSTANVCWGDPVIITPATTIYNSTGQTRNVIDHGHGVVAMGYGGLHLLDTAETYWSTWEYTDQIPDLIGYSECYSGVSSYFMYTWTTSNYVWRYPLASTSIPNVSGSVTHNARTQVAYSDIPRYTIYSSGGSNSYSSDFYLFGRDDTTSSYYYPVVRQGRFLFFGFTALLDRPYTGHVYTVNLVRYMSLY